ncbi:hypothetical protein ACFPYM_25590, partial [Methylobacterium hispanicum]
MHRTADTHRDLFDRTSEHAGAPSRGAAPREFAEPLGGLAPEQVLRMVEGFGLTGTWAWTFATDTHVWSPGLFRILGLEPESARAAYGLL